MSYLREDGWVLGTGPDLIEIRDWKNDLLWTFSTVENGIGFHHDIEPLPNGNILCIAHDIYSDVEIINEGRGPSLVNGEFRLNRILELSPIGLNEVEII